MKSPTPFTLDDYKTLVPAYAHHVDGDVGEVVSYVGSNITVIPLPAFATQTVNFPVLNTQPRNTRYIDATIVRQIVKKSPTGFFEAGYRLSFSSVLVYDDLPPIPEVITLKIKVLINENIAKEETVTVQEAAFPLVELKLDVDKLSEGGDVTIQVENTSNVALTLNNSILSIDTNFIGPEGNFADLFTRFYAKALERVYYEILGDSWDLGMAWFISHHLDLIVYDSERDWNLGQYARTGAPSSLLIKNGGRTFTFDNVMITSRYAVYWNLTGYGQRLIALYASNFIPTMFTVRSGTSRGF